MKKLFYLTLVCSMTFFITSCDKDDDHDDHNHDITAPSDYTFERNGATSVDYGGQTCRLNQASLLDVAMKDDATTSADITNMILGQFTESVESCDGQSISNKIAVGDNNTLSNEERDDVQTMFVNMTNDQGDVLASSGNTGSEGVAGTVYEMSAGDDGVFGTSDDANGTARWVNEKGVEPNQAIMKGLIGAMCLDQITNKYTHPDYMSGQSNDPNVLRENDTNMEHKWDEGFGYLYGRDIQTSPVLGADALLNKYLGKVSEVFPSYAEDIYNAFILGRAAIVAGDYDLRDEQADMIKEMLDDVVAYKASDYLRKGANELSSGYHANAFHDLSEGYGFVISLQFTDHFTHSEVNAMLASLMDGNGFWDRTAAELTDMADQIDAAMGFVN